MELEKIIDLELLNQDRDHMEMQLNNQNYMDEFRQDVKDQKSEFKALPVPSQLHSGSSILMSSTNERQTDQMSEADAYNDLKKSEMDLTLEGTLEGVSSPASTVIDTSN